MIGDGSHKGSGRGVGQRDGNVVAGIAEELSVSLSFGRGGSSYSHRSSIRSINNVDWKDVGTNTRTEGVNDVSLALRLMFWNTACDSCKRSGCHTGWRRG